MSGGLVDAIERLGPAELDAAESGYRWLGLDPADAFQTKFSDDPQAFASP